MSHLITKDYVNQNESYLLPRKFFTDPEYKPMRTESKIAYMLMLDLASQAIDNNWVNEKDEIYIIFPRDQMMKSLNIRGTQKAAAVMKELVDKGLIVIKKPGLGRCNQIFLCHNTSLYS